VCVLCVVGTGVLRLMNRWYQLHVLLVPQTSGVDDEISGFGGTINKFYTLMCLVGVSEENFMKYNIEDVPKSCPETRRCVERCRLHLFGRYPRRITSVTLSSVACLSLHSNSGSLP
jgi:hypothetical protein